MEDKVDNEPDITLKDLMSSSTNDDQLFKFAKDLYDGIETKTDIPFKNINLIIKLIFFADECKRYEIDTEQESIYDIVKDTILYNYYRLNISKSRLGRKEAFTFLNGTRTKENDDSGIFKRILGR